MTRPGPSPYLGQRAESRFQNAAPGSSTVRQNGGKTRNGWGGALPSRSYPPHRPPGTRRTPTLRAFPSVFSAPAPPVGSSWQSHLTVRSPQGASRLPRTESLVPAPKNSFSLLAQHSSLVGKLPCSLPSRLPKSTCLTPAFSLFSRILAPGGGGGGDKCATWNAVVRGPIQPCAGPPHPLLLGPSPFCLMKNDRMLTALSPEALPSALAMMGHPLRGLEMDKVTPS